ncbi:O-antigen ligase family protein [Massilia sp. B-10]|nr:O-antigen ligase family protein [Massilia sp. B-10]
MLGILSVILVLTLSYFVSDEWTSRMDTIGDAHADASFMGRVVAWKLSFIMAMRHPFFGGGFKALEYLPVWTSLSQDFFAYPFFYTGEALPQMDRAHAAHSVYFQVLGDHGFAGLAIFLAMLARAFILVRKVAVLARQQASTAWIAHLATMLQLSMFAYCLGGAALSFAYFEVLYAIFGLVQVLHSRILLRPPWPSLAECGGAADASGGGLSLSPAGELTRQGRSLRCALRVGRTGLPLSAARSRIAVPGRSSA